MLQWLEMNLVGVPFPSAFVSATDRESNRVPTGRFV
jgi:hypothetical protein